MGYFTRKNYPEQGEKLQHIWIEKKFDDSQNALYEKLAGIFYVPLSQKQYSISLLSNLKSR